MTDFTPETPVLTPIRDHAAELAKAEAGVAEMAAKRNNRWYPKYHIASNGGWINDPNGLCFYKGRWHVFYQLHPYGTQWGPMHWGHVSSTDMLNWKREPIMFAPSLEQEKDGVFSGSAVIDDNGDLRFYYTGHRWANGHDNTGGEFKPETEFRLWDCGHNYYAPQSFNAGGRQIVYGWMSPFVEPIPMQDDGWCGQLTLPREITLGDDGDVITAPVAEMEGLREDTLDHGSITLDMDGKQIIADDAEAVEIEMTIDLAASTAERAGLKIHATEDGAYTYVAYDAQIGRVVVNRQAMANGDQGYRAAPLTDAELASGKLDLRVFVDRGSVEVYVNSGHQVLSSYSYASEGPRAIKFVAEFGNLKVESLKLHHMKSIGLE